MGKGNLPLLNLLELLESLNYRNYQSFWKTDLFSGEKKEFLDFCNCFQSSKKRFLSIGTGLPCTCMGSPGCGYICYSNI